MGKQQQGTLFEPPDELDPWEEDDSSEQLLATVVVIDGPPQPLTYSVPDSLRETVAVGSRVEAPLGNRSIMGYCVGLESGRREFRLRPLKRLVDDQPLLHPRLIDLTRWMSDYYLCNWADAIEAAVPAGVRTQAGTRAMTFLSLPQKTLDQLDELKLSAKQRQALETLAASDSPLTPNELAARVGCSSGPIQSLRKKKLVEEEVRRVYQVELEERTKPEREQAKQLNDTQASALATIMKGIEAGRTSMTLVHGVTGSGKTEVYIQAIDEVIRHGKQAIVLVPEISLTPQTRQRFESRFDRVAVLHSHLSGPERAWHWRRIASGEVQVVVGARSAVFAPTKRLGLIVLDEEHDNSFKQDSPAPRYHAREVAMWRVRQEQAALVLGSATPSLESWQRAKSKHYELVSMPGRVLNLPLPDVGIVDLRQPRDEYSSGAIGRILRRAIDDALRDEGQVILLLNRRGYSTNIQCTACGETVTCPHCDVSLTHHLEAKLARCHYCEYQSSPPTNCPHCGFDGIRYSGLGTQKLEIEVRGKFPGFKCLRMDSDTMRKHGSHEEALQRFREGEAQILLGTQMIAKGLDFPNVTLVGVINADTALHFPDFRAAERTFQLVTQVAGRTGRGERGGRVLVQTFSPDHFAIISAQHHDYEAFAQAELPLREQFGYPPFGALARLIVRGPSDTMVQEFADSVANKMREVDSGDIETRVLGPAPAPLPKLQGRYRYHVLVSCTSRPLLRQILREAQEVDVPKDVQFAIDIDPNSML